MRFTRIYVYIQALPCREYTRKTQRIRILCVFPVYSLHGNAYIYTYMRAKRMGCPNDGLGRLNDAWGGVANFNEERVIFRYVKSIFGLGASQDPFGSLNGAWEA